MWLTLQTIRPSSPTPAPSQTLHFRAPRGTAAKSLEKPDLQPRTRQPESNDQRIFSFTTKEKKTKPLDEPPLDAFLQNRLLSASP